MDLQEARGWAEAVLREPQHAGKEVDGELVESFAKLLSERVQEDRAVRRFMGARNIMAAAFMADEGLRQAYVANVAMLLHDRFGVTGYEQRNAAAIAVLDLIFVG